LAQAGVGFTGTHLNLLGLDPSSPMSGVVNGGLFPNLGLNRYGEKITFEQEANENRLVGLYQVKTLQDPTFIPKGLKGSYAVSNDIILSYGGGPNSILGIGKTNIYFSDQRTGLNNPTVNPPFNTIFTLEKEGNSAIIRTDWSYFSGQSPHEIILNYSKAISLSNNPAYGNIKNNITPDGDLIRYDSVYKEDSLDPNPSKFGKSSWIPSFQSKVNYTGSLGASKKYQSYLDSAFNPLDKNSISENGDLLTNPNIYESGSLTPSNSNKFGAISWTPSFQDPVGPNSSTTYLEDLAITGSQSYPNLNIKPNVLVGGVIELNSVYESGSLERNKTSDRKFGDSSWTPSFQDPIGPNSPTNYLPSLAEVGSLSTITFDTNVQANGIQNLNSVYKSGSLESSDLLNINTKTLSHPQVLDAGDLNHSQNTLIPGAPSIIDFRKYLGLPNLDYTNKNLERRTNIGGNSNLGPGNKTGKDLSSYTRGSGIGPIDRINAQTLYSSESPNEQDYGDLIQFRIASLDSGGGNSKVFMHFRAFLDSFSDAFTANWQDHQYLGRGEKFYTYNGFTRAISLSWTVFAQSKEELFPMYEKLDYLASNLAPDYSTNGYMRGPLVSLTVGNYMYEQPGFISSLTYDIPTESPWEIAINDSGDPDDNMAQLPHMIKVTGFSFTPIFEFTPRKTDLFPAPPPLPPPTPTPTPTPNPNSNSNNLPSTSSRSPAPATSNTPGTYTRRFGGFGGGRTGGAGAGGIF
jgi:hypothetical protein